MPRRRRTRRCALPHRCLATIEPLERRDLPTATLPAFLAATGFGVTGGNPAIHADAVATDAAGDTVVVGSFRGTVSFAASGGAASFTSNTTQDTFVASYSPAGVLNWARTFAGQVTTQTSGGITRTITTVAEAAAVAVDSSGNVFLAGSFDGSVNFGTAAAPQVLASGGNTDSFVARLDNSGNLAWVRAAVASGGDNQANALALDGQGGVIVAGFFELSASIGATTLTSTASTDLYVARFTGAGVAAWATASRGTTGSNAQALGVAVDASGNIALAGFLSGSVNLAPGTATGSSTSVGSFDAFAAKLTAAGQFTWVRTFGSPDYDSGGAVAFDPSGNLLVTGTFSDSISFGTTSRPDTLTAGPVFDAFVLKLDPNGNEVWARGYVGASGWTKGQAIAVDPFGIIHVAGPLTGSADFDPGVGVTTLTSVGSTDVFVAGLDSAGNFVYATRAGQMNFNTALGLAVNAAGEVALAGTYSGSIAFGALPVAANGLASAFVARLQTQPTPAPSAPVLEAGSLTGTNNTTSITSPKLDVMTAGPGNVVQLLRDGTVVAQRTGPGALTDPGPVAQGVHLYTAVQVSTATVASVASPATTVTILTTPPAAPTGLGLLAADDSGTVGDGITNVAAPRIVGVAGAGLTVQLINAAGAVLASGVAGADGKFTIRLPAMADGVIPIRAVAVDLAANRAASAPFTLTILTTTPTPPAPILLAADDSGTVGDGITNVRSPRFTVLDASAASVTLVNATNAAVGVATTAIGGLFTIQVATSLADGTYSFRAVATDPAGNVSAAGAAVTVTISSAQPARLAAPTLLPADDSGTVGDGLTAVRRPRITGTAAPGAEVDWLSPSGAVLGSTLASATGTYILQAPTALPNGAVSISVRQVNSLGTAGPSSPPLVFTVRATTGDYFGLSLTDVAVFRPSNSTFYIWNPALPGLYARPFGIAGDVPISGDFFGDGAGDVAVFRPSTATFYILDPSTGAYAAQQWGTTGDVPVPADYDGDGRADVAVFRPSTATFFLRLSGSSSIRTIQWGNPGDIPVPGDYFGNGHADIAVYRPSNFTFYVFDPITGATFQRQWGGTDDIPVPGDYDGDGKTDPAVFNTDTSTYYVLQSSSSLGAIQQWGTTGDIPVAGDYFGGGRASYAVYLPGNHTFYAADPVTGRYLAFPWGIAGDQPIQPPLATNFNLGGGGGGGGGGRASAIVIRPGTTPPPPPPATATDGPTDGPTDVDFVPTAVGIGDDTARMASATPPAPAKAPAGLYDEALDALGLERWRVD